MVMPGALFARSMALTFFAKARRSISAPP